LILKRPACTSPEGKGSLNSLYTIDEEVEREKALLLDEMASTLAHEIRNPLGSIKGAAQYLKSDSESAENRELFNVITSEIDRLNNVVSRFLNYAKPGTINPDTRDIADILESSVDEALAFFGNIPRIKNKLQTLADVGLGYIKLGQSATTLSGGEAQRIKLARELSKKKYRADRLYSR